MMSMISFFNSLLRMLLLLLAFTSVLAEDNNNNNITDSGGICVFDDGIEYTQGEDLGTSFESRCGSGVDFPCFCAPDDPFQAFCPYCGFSSEDGSLYCARDGETISFPDGSIVRVCSCQFFEDLTLEPLRNCTVEGGGGGSGFDGECELPDADGELVQFNNGDSFGDLIEGACGSASEWPSFCRVLDEQGNFDISYPYCVFNDVSFDESPTGILCAQDGDTLIYIDDNNAEQTCTCTVSPEGDAVEQCNQAPTVEPEPTEEPTEGPEGPSSPTFAPITTNSALTTPSLNGVAVIGGIVSVLISVSV
jgi:hypothetical protein